MKKLSLFLLLSLPVYSQDTCVSPTSSGLSDIQKCLDFMAKAKNSDTPEAALAAAEAFLTKHLTTVNFEFSEANLLLDRLMVYANSTSLSDKKRSIFWSQASGIHGKIADKHQSKASIPHGKQVISCLKTSLKLDKGNINAASGFALTIVNFTEKDAISRKFIEMGLKIKIKDEAKAAVKYLEDSGQRDHPAYEKLKKF